LFTATFAILVGYAARRRWAGRRGTRLRIETGPGSLTMSGETDEEQPRLVDALIQQVSAGGSITVEQEASEPAPEPRAAPMQTRALTGWLSNVRMIHVITLLFLIVSFWIILSNKYDDDVQKWAFGAMGSILGFWLAPGRD